MKILLFTIYLFCSHALSAQMPEYYVDLIKGDISVRKSGKKTVPLKPRTLLYKNDVIIINKAGAEITLVNKDREYLVLNNKGTYSVNQLASRPKEKAHGVTEKYFHHVWEELLHPSKDPGKYKLENLVASFGGVSRGGCQNSLHPTPDISLSSDTIHFKWKASSKSQPYKFLLSDAEQRPVLELITNDTVLVISNKGRLINDENIYYWKVTTSNSDCDESIQKLTWLKQSEYERQIKEIIDSINKEDSNQNLEISKALYDRGFFNLSAEYLVKAILGSD